MQQLFWAVMRLYPEEYRAVFGDEMLAVLASRAADLRNVFFLKSGFWVIAEIAGLARGAVAEHIARWADRKRYRAVLDEIRPDDLAQDAAALRSRLNQVIHLMERAIAHHDFPKARFYSDEERKTRYLLSQVEGKC